MIDPGPPCGITRQTPADAEWQQDVRDAYGEAKATGSGLSGRILAQRAAALPRGDGFVNPLSKLVKALGYPAATQPEGLRRLASALKAPRPASAGSAADCSLTRQSFLHGSTGEHLGADADGAAQITFDGSPRGDGRESGNASAYTCVTAGRDRHLTGAARGKADKPAAGAGPASALSTNGKENL